MAHSARTPQAGARNRAWPARSPASVAGRARRVQQARHAPNPPAELPGLTHYPEATTDDLLLIRIPPGTTIDGAIVALCPDGDGLVFADVCIDGPPVK